MIIIIPLWIQILKKKILHLLINAYPCLDPTYIMIATVPIMSVMSTTMNESTAQGLIIIPQLIPIIYPTRPLA